jgi:hypothetical protein
LRTKEKRWAVRYRGCGGDEWEVLTGVSSTELDGGTMNCPEKNVAWQLLSTS